eukprot:778220-Pyramimonas_sp.AAC.1
MIDLEGFSVVCPIFRTDKMDANNDWRQKPRGGASRGTSVQGCSRLLIGNLGFRPLRTNGAARFWTSNRIRSTSRRLSNSRRRWASRCSRAS